MTATAVIVAATAPMEVGEAKRIDKKIRLLADTVRDNLHKIAALVEEAKQGQIHVALGFNSWTAYLADALGGQLKLDTDARRAVVALMSGHGASQRTIAQAVGTSQKTVSRDLQVSHNDSPEGPWESPAVGGPDLSTGLDGKTYSRDRPARVPRRKPFMNSVSPMRKDLARARKKLQTVLEDNRFRLNREVIIRELRVEAESLLGLLQHLLEADGQ
jgi:hypothetical protein